MRRTRSCQPEPTRPTTSSGVLTRARKSHSARRARRSSRAHCRLLKYSSVAQRWRSLGYSWNEFAAAAARLFVEDQRQCADRSSVSETFELRASGVAPIRGSTSVDAPAMLRASVGTSSASGDIPKPAVAQVDNLDAAADTTALAVPGDACARRRVDQSSNEVTLRSPETRRLQFAVSACHLANVGSRPALMGGERQAVIERSRPAHVPLQDRPREC
jgi:hypothetical protein